MKREKTYFGAGIVIGAVLAALFLFNFAPRYRVAQGHGTLVKQDSWTGQSWRLVENNWEKVADGNYDWEKTDETLRQALRLSSVKVDTDDALSLLRKKHPLLKEISDEELLERIKLVYSKQILCNLYLENFVKLQEMEGVVPKD